MYPSATFGSLKSIMPSQRSSKSFIPETKNVDHARWKTTSRTLSNLRCYLFSLPSPDCIDAHPSRPKSGQRLPQGWIMMVEVVWVCVSPGSNNPQKQPAERCHDGILQNSKASGWDYYGLWQNICHMSILST